VLATGVVFGLTGIRPIPAIVAAQALNGILLPFVAVFLLIVVNDRALMGDRGVNSHRGNAVMAIVVAVTILLGIYKLAGAATRALEIPALSEGNLLAVSAILTILLAWPVVRAVRRRRRATA